MSELPVKFDQKAQGLRCACQGVDEWCACQNVPDQATIRAHRKQRAPTPEKAAPARGLREELAEAEATAERLRRRIAAASCAEVGCDMVFYGGSACSCEGGGCSRSVYVCSRCGDCDYGENEESEEIERRCKEARQ